jgi:hypothetical protein
MAHHEPADTHDHRVNVRPNKMMLAALSFPLFMAIALPGLYLAAFHEPSPDHMKVQIIGTSDSAQQLAAGLTTSSDGSFEASTVADSDTAVEHLEVLTSRGAYDPATGDLYVASAGSPAAEQAVRAAFESVAADDGQELTVTDVAPLPDHDRLGVTSLFMGLGGVLAGFTCATVLGSAVRNLRLRHEIAIIGLMSATAGVLTTFIGYAVYGALTTELLGVGTIITAVAFVSGLIQSGGLKLIGPGMTVISVIILILLGVPASGAAIPADMTPGFFADLQTLLPTSAALDALRRTIYFGGTGIGPNLAALAFWGLLGAAMIGISRLKSPGADDAARDAVSPFPVDDSLTPEQASLSRKRLITGLMSLPLFFAIFLPLLFVGVFHAPSPRGMDIAVIGTTGGAHNSADQLRASGGDAFDVSLVDDRTEAVRQLKDLQIRAAFDPSTGDIYVASAAGVQSEGAAVAVLTDAVQSTGATADVHDVAPLPDKDPVGTSALYLALGAVVGGFLTAVVVALIGAKVSAAWQTLTVLVTGVVVAAIETSWGWLVFDVFASSAMAGFGMLLALATVSGLVTLAGMRKIGPAQIMVSILLLVLAAVTSSGLGVQLDLAPGFYGFIHELLPTSRGMSALRDVIYFGGAGIGWDLAVIGLWTIAAIAVIVATRDSGQPQQEHAHAAADDEADSATPADAAAGVTAPASL